MLWFPTSFRKMSHSMIATNLFSYNFMALKRPDYQINILVSFGDSNFHTNKLWKVFVLGAILLKFWKNIRMVLKIFRSHFAFSPTHRTDHRLFNHQAYPPSDSGFVSQWHCFRSYDNSVSSLHCLQHLLWMSKHNAAWLFFDY